MPLAHTKNDTEWSTLKHTLVKFLDIQIYKSGYQKEREKKKKKSTYPFI